MSKRSRRTARAVKADAMIASAVYATVDRVVTNKNDWSPHARIIHCLNLAADFRRRGLLHKARDHLGFIKNYRD